MYDMYNIKAVHKIQYIGVTVELLWTIAQQLNRSSGHIRTLPSFAPSANIHRLSIVPVGTMEGDKNQAIPWQKYALWQKIP